MVVDITGFAEFQVGNQSFKTWYKVVGNISNRGQRPLVVLHGGPGLTHHYMLPLQALAESHGIPVVFYDQIGNGSSSHYRSAPKDFWTLELFMDQLDNLLDHLKIRFEFDLLGHSWGGFLAAYYASTRPANGLRNLILSNAPASIELLENGLNLHLDKFPKEFAQMMRGHEADDTTNDPEYGRGMQKFMAKHLCTLSPWPRELMESFAANGEDPTVSDNMLGPYQFQIVGTLRPYSTTGFLHTIRAATLVVHSPEDEVHEIAIQPFLDHIFGARRAELQNSTHLPMFEETKTYLATISSFLLGSR